MYIPKRSPHCIIDGKKWQPEMEYISLVWSTEEQWRREDYCCLCWISTQKEKELPQGGCFWKAKISVHNDLQAHVVIPKKAVELFVELASQQEENHLLYILALFLERKKILHKRQELKNARKHYLIFEIPEKEMTFSVKPFPLTEQEIRVLYDELTFRLRDS